MTPGTARPSLRFADALARRVLLFDGAMGTSVHACPDCGVSDYLGRDNCTDILVRSRPALIQSIHESFLAAGADVVETNTFGANRLVAAEFDQELVGWVPELNRQAALVARAACDRFSTPEKPRFVAGSMGPGTKLITLGNTDWPTMLASYREQAAALLEGGVDCFIIETCQDLLQVKCAVNACLDALADAKRSPEEVPIMVSVTVETTGTMLLGSDIGAVLNALAPFPIASLGLNCATGPVEMAEHIAYLSKHWSRAISVIPNAGLPILVEGRTEYPLAAGAFAAAMRRFMEEFRVNVVGGCCGTTPGHIRALSEVIDGRVREPRTLVPLPPGCSSLYSMVEFRQENSFLIVAERTNANGSRAFKRMLDAEEWDGLLGMAKEEIRDGSQLLDLCVDFVGRDGVRDMSEVSSRLVRQVNAPLMLDSTQADVIEAGLQRAGGKCVVNSINLEDGEKRFDEICPLLKRYGAACVALTIDEDPVAGMAKSADRKLAIAERMHDLFTRKWGLDEQDLLFDPLTFTIATGNEEDRRLALETLDGIERISRRFPKCGILLGLSNVSFGLKPPARAVLNSVFLAEALERGLTAAIVHASRIQPRDRIDPEHWEAARWLIFDARGERRPEGKAADFDPLLHFISLFPDGAEATVAKRGLDELPLEERLQRHIVDGDDRNLERTLEEARSKYAPLAIINDHLLAGMKTVGELFASGRMQLPFVLQSASVMKKSVALLQPFMEKSETGQARAKVVLATVAGDVHDIGKNLVDIILSNNGYEVHNIGIKQSLQQIVEAWRRTGADVIGMSGLLVKSVTVMEQNLHELNAIGVTVPVMLGGAALTRHYAESHLRKIYKGPVYYGKDAFEGLAVCDALASGELSRIDAEVEARLQKRAEVDARVGQRLESRADGAVGGAVATATASGATGATPAGVTPTSATSRAQGGGASGATPAGGASSGAPRRAEDAPSPRVTSTHSLPKPPFLGDRIVEDIDLRQIYPFVNKVALYRGQWGFKKGAMDEASYERLIEDQADAIFARLQVLCREERILRPAVAYGYFECQSRGDELLIYDPENPAQVRETFRFPRQSGRERLCISDFFRSVESGERDVIGFHCVTMGIEVSHRARQLFERNEYTEYLYMHGMGVECTEALAELWHKRMRSELGIGGDDDPRVERLFTQHYRGSRYSFGYPACPDMSDQEKLFRLLRPERIGCTLTENWQIVPEQSTSAIIVHHPQAKYFAV
ncbi:MAG: homocysteine S-methyltransferase family protein [Phycisphaeraceae bacterium]|nr:homocysteine S-methyltransferase family protein [Phycisphaeraceae bacterium]